MERGGAGLDDSGGGKILYHSFTSCPFPPSYSQYRRCNHFVRSSRVCQRLVPFLIVFRLYPLPPTDSPSKLHVLPHGIIPHLQSPIKDKVVYCWLGLVLSSLRILFGQPFHSNSVLSIRNTLGFPGSTSHKRGLRAVCGSTNGASTTRYHRELDFRCPVVFLKGWG